MEIEVKQCKNEEDISSGEFQGKEVNQCQESARGKEERTLNLLTGKHSRQHTGAQKCPNPNP